MSHDAVLRRQDSWRFSKRKSLVFTRPSCVRCCSKLGMREILFEAWPQFSPCEGHSHRESHHDGSTTFWPRPKNYDSQLQLPQYLTCDSSRLGTREFVFHVPEEGRPSTESSATLNIAAVKIFTEDSCHLKKTKVYKYYNTGGRLD